MVEANQQLTSSSQERFALEDKAEAEPSAETKAKSAAITVISANEVATMLGLSLTSVYEGARSGEIPCKRVGRKFIFVRETLQNWLLGGLA